MKRLCYICTGTEIISARFLYLIMCSRKDDEKLYKVQRSPGKWLKDCRTSPTRKKNKYRRIIYFQKLKVKKWRDQWLNILSWWNMITEKFSTRKHKDNNPLLLFFPNNTNISVGWFRFPVISILMLQNPFLKVISDLHMILILSLRKRNSWTISAIIICWKLHPEAWQLKFQVVESGCLLSI